MPPERLVLALAEMTEAEADDALHDWSLWHRPSQVEPGGNWRHWLLMSGRGFGKTRVGAEWTRSMLMGCPGCRIAIVARTFADARDTCIEGESGLMACLSESERAGSTWNRSMGEGRLANASQFKVFTSEKPDSLRGPQFHFAWCDELAAWEKQRAAWQQIPFIVRLPWPARPEISGRIVVTTTPRPVVELRELLQDKTTVVTRGNSLENWQNLNAATRIQLEKLRGTRLGRQEIDGEMLDDTPGALWSRALIERQRTQNPPTRTSRIVVAVDPAASSHEDSDETGIVVCARGMAAANRPARFVLEDCSMRGKPHEWAAAAIEAYRRHRADCIVVETNQGGEMCKAVLSTVDSSVPVQSVHATRGKAVRAEPVATATEHGDIWFVGRKFERLEDQLCTWTQDDNWSPDRLDAMVWAMTELDTGADLVMPGIPRAGRRTGIAAVDL